jgi:hypothetical protein
VKHRRRPSNRFRRAFWNPERERVAMPDPRPADRPSCLRLARVLAITAKGLAVLALASVFIAPAGTASQQFSVGPSTPESTTITVPHPGWVTVHFDHPTMASTAMRYRMQRGGQMMHDPSMITAGDSDSFWSLGGAYQCRATMLPPTGPAMPMWVNATGGPF